MSALDPIESAVKLALDHAELVELVPELQRSTAAANFDDGGGLVLVLPRHPAVIAFIHELDAQEYETADDLKTARRRLRANRNGYQIRVANRINQTVDGSAAFDRFVSLSAILIARAAGKHWHKIVAELEHAERIKKHNERAAELVPLYIVIDGHPVRVRRERERPSP
jgi:hypothetical protein